MRVPHRPSSWWPLVWLAAALLLGVAAYWPGLQGGFLFDDFGNLPTLGATGPIDNWPTFYRYITSGIADPTGRPLTLLSFLLDARTWPADPFPFKRTNLILHLLNGLLLYALLSRFGRMLTYPRARYRTAAVIGTALWLLHPLFVSTTLYVVQREAMLPATCVLAGLLIWMHGRTKLAAKNIGSGLAWSVLGLGGFTTLGVLAKANGALLPLYALLIEALVLRVHQPLPIGAAQRSHRWLMLLLAALPAAALVGYLGLIGARGILIGGESLRPWTSAQRLLTEPRVLVDYLSLLWFPRPFSSGLFNDQYIASTSLWQPLTTLPAIMLLVGLLVAAWWLRRRHAPFALALLFYFAGQLLESTTIPLELYFEHRNYVPALLMFWPMGLWLADLRTLPALKCTLWVVLPLGLAAMTHARAQVWGDEKTQALIWASINPNSPRAQANAAQIEMQHGHPREAIQRLEPLLRNQPDQAQLAFNLIGAHCLTGGVSADDMAAARRAMGGTANTGTLFSHWFDRVLPIALSGRCQGLKLANLLELINAGLHNPRLDDAGPRQDLTFMRGRIALARRQPDAALSDFIDALDLQVRPGMALQAAATLGAAGYPSHGLQLLDHYEQVQNQVMPPGIGMPMLHEWVLNRENYWPHELAHLRIQLSLDAQARSTNTSSPPPAQAMPR